MPNPEPLQFGQYYHIFNRGNNREILFREERNYPYFLSLFIKHIDPIADTYAYCLMPNHFHLLVQVKEFEPCEKVCQSFKDWQTYSHIYPSRAFSKVFSTYTKAFNKAYQRTGSLFEKPFKRKRVNDDRYFTTLVVYIHYNPQNHGLVTDFREWPHSSYKEILSNNPTFMHREQVLDWFGGRKQYEQLHDLDIDQAQIEPLMLDDEDVIRTGSPYGF